MKRIIQNLKKLIMTIAIFLASSSFFINAQEIHFGAKVGLNLTDIYGVMSPGGPPMGTSSVALGYHVGGIVDIAFNDNISLAPEILYSTAGTKENLSYTLTNDLAIPMTIVTSGTMSLNLGYLQIPIMVKYKMDNGINFSVGPTFGMLLTSSYLGNETVNITTFTKPPIISNSTSTPAGKLDTAMNKTDIGFAIGGGYQFDFGLGFGIRYIFGFSQIFKGGISYPDTSDPYGRTVTQGPYGQNETLQISVSYLFGMSK
jgi:opacity protein-like surface antigen